LKAKTRLYDLFTYTSDSLRTTTEVEQLVFEVNSNKKYKPLN